MKKIVLLVLSLLCITGFIPYNNINTVSAEEDNGNTLTLNVSITSNTALCNEIGFTLAGTEMTVYNTKTNQAIGVFVLDANGKGTVKSYIYNDITNCIGSDSLKDVPDGTYIAKATKQPYGFKNIEDTNSVVLKSKFELPEDIVVYSHNEIWGVNCSNKTFNSNQSRYWITNVIDPESGRAVPLYCAQSHYSSPYVIKHINGDTHHVSTKDNNFQYISAEEAIGKVKQVRKLLYYGYGGPGQWEGFTSGRYDTPWVSNNSGGYYKGGAEVLGSYITHAAISYVYSGWADNDGGITHLQQCGYSDFISYVNAQPDPPDSYAVFKWANSGDVQDMFMGVTAPSVEYQSGAFTTTATPLTDPASLTVNKNGSNNVKLEGAKFRFDYYQNNFVPFTTLSQVSGKTLTRSWVFESDSNGEIYYENPYKVSGDELYRSESGIYVMPPGTYVITEIEAPNGYALADPIILTVGINSSNTGYTFQYYESDGEYATETIVDQKLGKLQFYKMAENIDEDVVNGTAALSLKGTQFTLYEDANKTVVAKDNDGNPAIFTIGDGNYSEIRELIPGYYYWVETKGPDNYQTPSQEATYVYVSESSAAAEKVVVKVSNALKDAPVKLHKSSTNAVYALTHSMEGAEYTVYTDAECKTSAGMFRIGADGYSTQSKRFPLYVTYYVKETNAPSGYTLNPTVYTFELTADNLTSGQDLVIEVEDTPANGYVDLIKTSSNPQYQQKHPLSNAYFEVFDSHGMTTSVVLVTDESGKAGPAELPANDSDNPYYILRETRAPFGYGLLEDIQFTVTVAETTHLDAEHGFNLAEMPNIEYIYLNKEFDNSATSVVVPSNINGSNFKIEYSKIEDYRENNPFINAQYVIYKSLAAAQSRSEAATDIAGVLVTDADGKTQTLELPLGTYYVREKQAPTGYQIDDKIYNETGLVLDSPGETYHFTVKEEGANGTLRLFKESSDPEFGASHSVEQATYGVYTSRACNSADQVNTLVIGTDGNSTSVLSLPEGTYFIKEITPANLYALDETVYEVYVPKVVDTKLSVKEEPNVMKVRVHKQGIADTEYMSKFPVAGATYRLYTSGSAGSGSSAYVSNPTPYTLIIGADGYSEWLEVPKQNYYMKEILAPEGWSLDNTVYAVPESSIDSPVTINVTEEAAYGRFRLLKVYEGTTTPIPGVSFLVKGTSKAGDTVYKKVTTGDDGMIIDWLPFSTPSGYQVTEIYDPNNGLVKNDTVYNVVIDANSGTITTTVPNTRKVVGYLEFYKTDRSHNGLSGAVFQLEGTSDYGTEYNRQFTSGSDGIIRFDNLEKGSYQLYEVLAPAGYKEDSTSHTVTVSANGQRATISPIVTYSGRYEIQNDKTYQLKIRKRDGIRGNTLTGAEFNLKGTSKYGTDYNMTVSIGSDGTAVFTNLEETPDDSYYSLTETVAPANYNRDETTYKVHVSSSGVSIENMSLDGDAYTFYNYAKGGDIIIIKRWDDNGATERPDVTFHLSNYEPGYYNILFVANGKPNNEDITGSTAEQNYRTGDPALTLSANGFSRTGYTFVNWNTRPDGTGTTYTNQQSVTPDEHLVLYAQWKPITYTVEFRPNNTKARGSMEKQTFTYDVAQNLKPNSFWLGYDE